MTPSVQENRHVEVWATAVIAPMTIQDHTFSGESIRKGDIESERTNKKEKKESSRVSSGTRCFIVPPRDEEGVQGGEVQADRYTLSFIQSEREHRHMA